MVVATIPAGEPCSRAGYLAAASIATDNCRKQSRSQHPLQVLSALLLALRSPALGHQRGREVHAGKIGAAQVCFTQDGHAQIRTHELGSPHIGPAKVDIAQLRSLKICVRQVTAEKLDAARLRFCKVGAGQNCFGQVRVAQIGLAQVRAREVGSRKLRSPQISTFKIRIAQDGAAEVHAAQVRARKVRAGEIGPGAGIFPLKKQRVRLEYRGHGLAVVPNAFRLPQSHDRPAISRVCRIYSTEARGNRKAAPRTYSSIERDAYVLPPPYSRYRLDGLWPYDIAIMNHNNHLRHSLWLAGSFALVLVFLCLHTRATAQTLAPEDEIVANLAGGRVIVHVARDANIVFAAINEPVEAGGVPPRVVEVDSTHVAVLLGASEWRLPADPNPVRLDRNFERVHARDPKYQYDAGEAEPDLETIGVAVLERLRPLTAQLHHKIDLRPDEPLLELVLIGYAPNNYGPEVWTVEYRVQQEQVATRGEYWQTRILRPRFTQLYPPEKHAPRMIVEARYPADLKAPTLMALIQGNDPTIAQLGGSDARFAKVIEAVDKGQAQKAAPADAADFLRAVLPLIAGEQSFILAKMEEQHGFNWIVPPDEPVERAKKGEEDKNRPPDAPSLRRRPNPPDR